MKADDAFRNYAHDRELRLVIGKKLLNLVRMGSSILFGCDSSP